MVGAAQLICLAKRGQYKSSGGRALPTYFALFRDLYNFRISRISLAFRAAEACEPLGDSRLFAPHAGGAGVRPNPCPQTPPRASISAWGVALGDFGPTLAEGASEILDQVSGDLG